MITQEQIELNGKVFLYTYSDLYYIQKEGTEQTYEEAYDVMPCKYTYVESEQELPEEVVEERKKRKETQQ